jgi:hypothetical protein
MLFVRIEIVGLAAVVRAQHEFTVSSIINIE